MLTLSLVIPVFNEEHQIKECLNSISEQTIMPNEVIVVDNNCTDRTVEIASAFPFVTVVKEPRQGRGWARSAGFDSANCQIIGRIDADSRLEKDWVETVLAGFSEDKDAFGMTGLGKTLITQYSNKYSTFWSRAYYWYVHASFRTISMWGANMAIRREAWLQVKPYVCNDDTKVHEDQDISLLLAIRGMKIIQNNNMLIRTEGRSYNYLPKLMHYYRLHKSTKKLHRSRMQSGQVYKYPLSFFGTLPGRSVVILLTLPFLIMSIVHLPIDIVRGFKDR